MASLVERDGRFYIQWYEGKTQRRRTLRTDVLQIAKEKLRQFESAKFRGEDHLLPMRTPIGTVVAAYIEHMRAHRPERSWAKDLSYLRESFGECCPALVLTSERAKKNYDRKVGKGTHNKQWPIHASYFEDITTTQISEFITTRKRIRNLAGTTANRYREVIAKVFNWAMNEELVRMPSDRNPAAKVKRYKSPAPEIRFMTLEQINEQLEALQAKPLLQVMVATLIYSGVRREELLWLQVDDLTKPTAQSPSGMLRVRAKTASDAYWQPKTRKNRAVPVSEDLRKYLDAWEVPTTKEGWLFPSPEGKRWDTNNFSHALRRVNKDAGLPWSCLDYRHTFGSQLAQNGVSLFQIATLMGNSPEICQRHYAALVPELMSHLVCFTKMKTEGNTRTTKSPLIT